MNVRIFALGLVAVIACAGTVRAQNKMPIPVEDDPTSDLNKKAAPTPASSTPAHPPPEVVGDSDQSPAHQALLAYKAGKLEEAASVFNGLDPATLDDNAIILESRILTELKRYDEGEKLLRSRLAGANAVAVETALGDLLLYKHSFPRAVKYYGAVLQAKPDDPDIILKLVYAKIGAADYVGAGQDASRLSPLDPKNPYDDHASYYFARAALAQSAGRSQEAEDQIQAARTNYGITVTNRYLKTYLQVFAATDDGQKSDMTPPARVKESPTK